MSKRRGRKGIPKLRTSDIRSHPPLNGFEKVAAEFDEAVNASGGDYELPEHIVVEINQERKYQLEKGYDAEHDDDMEYWKWFHIMRDHLAEYDYKEHSAALSPDSMIDPRSLTRTGLVKLVAIAVAGIESLDRIKAAELAAMDKVDPDEKG